MLAAIPIYSTGVAANGQLAGNASIEVHFQLVSGPSGSSQPFVYNPPHSAYVGNGPNSQWIGPAANPYDSSASGDYRYRQTFDLSGLDPATAVLNLRLASDNNSRVFLNGVDTNVALIQANDFDLSVYELLRPFTISTGFIAGVNTLDVVVNNPAGATGFQLELSGTADPAAPAAVTLTSAVAGASATIVSGELTSSLSGRPYTVEFFAGPDASPPVAPGFPIGSISVTTDAQGRATFTTELPLASTSSGYIFARGTGAGDGPGAFFSGVPVPVRPDLSVAFVTSTSTATANSDFNVVFTVSNTSGAVAPGVVLSVATPMGLAVSAAVGSTGVARVVDGGATLSIPTLGPGESATITLTARAAAAGNLPVSAVATSDFVDTRPQDDSSRVVVNVAPAPVVPTPGPGPVVVSVRRAGSKTRPTQIVLAFDQPLDPGNAANVNNYGIALAGPDGKFGTRDDKRVTLALAAYNSEFGTVTLVPVRRLGLKRVYQVTASGDGPNGVANLRGGALNSGPDGKAGPVHRVVMRGFGPLAAVTARQRRR